MNIVERKNLVLNLLEKKDFMMVDEIAELVQASKATVRRDLQDMEDSGLVKRFHGGVSLQGKVLVEDSVSLPEMMTINLDEKKKIAKIGGGIRWKMEMSIFLDSGSTTYSMVEYLTAKEIQVVTNGVQHATQLCGKRIPVYLLGGNIIPDSMSIFSEESISILENMNFDKVFLGTRGVDIQAGYTTTNQSDAMIKSTALSRAVKGYVLADFTKIGKRKFFTFATLDDAVCISTAEARKLLPGLELLA